MTLPARWIRETHARTKATCILREAQAANGIAAQRGHPCTLATEPRSRSVRRRQSPKRPPGHITTAGRSSASKTAAMSRYDTPRPATWRPLIMSSSNVDAPASSEAAHRRDNLRVVATDFAYRFCLGAGQGMLYARGACSQRALQYDTIETKSKLSH